MRVLTKNKFTLIELLVVVAIIGILVSILMPSLNSAREKAKVAVCMSNHNQIAKAYYLYSVKNDNIAVEHKTYSSFLGQDGQKSYYKNLPRRLNEYADFRIAECPSDLGFFKYYGNSYYSTLSDDSGDSESTIDPSTSTAGRKLLPLKFDHPDKKILFYNRNVRNSNSQKWNTNRRQLSWHSQKNLRYPISFIDGHVEYFHFKWREQRPKYNGKSMQWKLDNLGYY